MIWESCAKKKTPKNRSHCLIKSWYVVSRGYQTFPPCPFILFPLPGMPVLMPVRMTIYLTQTEILLRVKKNAYARIIGINQLCLGKPRHITTYPRSIHLFPPSYHLLPVSRSSLRSSTLSSPTCTLEDHSWALLSSVLSVVLGHLSHPPHWTWTSQSQSPGPGAQYLRDALKMLIKWRKSCWPKVKVKAGPGVKLHSFTEGIIWASHEGISSSTHYLSLYLMISPCFVLSMLIYR